MTTSPGVPCRFIPGEHPPGARDHRLPRLHRVEIPRPFHRSIPWNGWGRVLRNGIAPARSRACVGQRLRAGAANGHDAPDERGTLVCACRGSSAAAVGHLIRAGFMRSGTTRTGTGGKTPFSASAPICHNTQGMALRPDPRGIKRTYLPLIREKRHVFSNTSGPSPFPLKWGAGAATRPLGRAAPRAPVHSYSRGRGVPLASSPRHTGARAGTGDPGETRRGSRPPRAD